MALSSSSCSAAVKSYHTAISASYRPIPSSYRLLRAHGKPIASSISVIITSIIIIPLLIPPLIERIVNIIIKPLHSSLLTSSPPSNILWDVFDVLHPVVPLPLHVFGDVLHFLCLAAGPAGDVFGGVLEPLLEPVFVVVEALFVALPVFFCCGELC